MRKIGLALLSLTVFLAASADGTVRYVSAASGINSGDGTDPQHPIKSIQYAVDQAVTGDEIWIATYDVVTVPGPPPTVQTNFCVYTGSGVAVVALRSGSSFSLKGGYIYLRDSGNWQAGVVPALVNAENTRRGLYCAAGNGDTNTVELVEFMNGSATNGANIYATGGSLQMIGTPIHNGTATAGGGGIYMQGVDFSVSMGSYSNLALPQMSGMLPIYSNSAAYGGGLYLDGGYPVITTVGLMNNTASSDGGGLYINGGYPSIIGGTVKGNTAARHGGGIYMTNSIARIGGMIINDNVAGDGGGVYLDGPFAQDMESAPLLANNYIQNNEATGGQGGGIFFNEANVGIVNNIITGNIATDGAAAYLNGSSPRFMENTIADNSGKTGIYITNATGAGRVIVVHTWFGTYTNLVAGIPVPSQPAMTNNIISGHITALYVTDSGNSLLPNRVEMGYTDWDNTVNIGGPGEVNHHDDIKGNPRFTSTGSAPSDTTPYHIDTNSPAFESGTGVSLTLPGTDLLLDIDGQTRPSGSGMDIGADEVVTDPYSVWFVPAVISKTVTAGTVVTNIHQLLNSGTQEDTYTIAVSNTLWVGSVSPTSVLLQAQSYTSVTVTINVPASTAEGTTNITTLMAVSTAEQDRKALALDSTGVSTNAGKSQIHYVWQNSPSPQSPYATPETAGHSIQTVLDITSDGDTVLVYPGTYDSGGHPAQGYALTNRVCITNEITLQSISEPDDTIIIGSMSTDPSTTNGPGAIRGVYIRQNATIAGFSIIDGHTYTNGISEDREGGGIYINNSSIVSNCLIEACSSDFHGGGLCIGSHTTVVDTDIGGNESGAFGGGVDAFFSNTFKNCTIVNNRSASYGGGIFSGSYDTMTQVTVVSNSAGIGGGINLSDNATANGCEVRGNVAHSGGGVFCEGGTVANSLISGNTASYGGGIYISSGGQCVNCTIVTNSGSFDSSGLYIYNDGGSVINTIIYNNDGGNWHSDAGTNGIWRNCCTTPNPDAGGNNITNAPLFMDSSSGDWHIPTNSPCVDSGTAVATNPNSDLDGKHRPLDGKADGILVMDIGCYEVANVNGDSDGDGQSDSNEKTADTDPYDPSDYFRITAVSNDLPVTIYFDSATNRVYYLLGCTNLTTHHWLQVPGGAYTGKGGEAFVRDTNSPACGPFYKLQVIWP